MSETVKVDAPIEWLVAWSENQGSSFPRWETDQAVFDDDAAAAKFARGLELIAEADDDRIRHVTVYRRVGEVPASEWSEPLDRSAWPRYSRRAPDDEAGA